MVEVWLSTADATAVDGVATDVANGGLGWQSCHYSSRNRGLSRGWLLLGSGVAIR